MQDHQWSIWDAAIDIGTPLALSAFALAVGLFVARSYFTKRRKEIESAAPEQRVEMVAALEGTFDVNTRSLPETKRFELAKEILRVREQRFRTSARVAAFMATLLALVALIAMLERRGPQVVGGMPPHATQPQPPLEKAIAKDSQRAATPPEPAQPRSLAPVGQPASEPPRDSRNTKAASALPARGAEEPSERASSREAEPTRIVNRTRVAGNVRATGDAQQNVGVVRGRMDAPILNATQVGGNVTATGRAEQSVGVVGR